MLKKKKYLENLLEKTEGSLFNLEKLVRDIEFSQVQYKVVEGLKVGNEALKKINEMMSIEEIENILEETREGIDKQKVS